MSFISILSHFVLDFYVSFFTPLGPYLIRKLSVEPRLFTFVLTISASVLGFLQVFFGYIFDKSKNNIRNLILIYLAHSIGVILLGFSNSLVLIFLSIMIVRLGNSAFHPLGASLASEKGSSRVAFFSMAGTFGAALGPIFISSFVSTLEFKYVSLSGIPLLLIIPFLINSGRNFQKSENSQKNGKITSEEIKLILPIFLVVSGRSFLTSVTHTYAPIFSTSLGFSLVKSGSLLTFGMLIGVVSNYVGVVLIKKIGSDKLDFLGFLGMGISVLLFTFSRNYLLLVLFYVLFDAFAFLLMSANVVQAQQTLPNRKAFASSVAMGFAWATGDLIASFYNLSFGNNASVTLIGIGILALIFSTFFVKSLFKFSWR